MPVRVSSISLPSPSIELRPSDFATVLAATQRLHLVGTVALRAGRYRVKQSDAEVTRLTVAGDTTVHYDLLVALDEVTTTTKGARFTPRIEAFELDASTPLEVELKSLTVAVGAVELRSGTTSELTPEILVARTLAKSIANLALSTVGVRQSLDESIAKVFQSAAISELTITLEPGARIDYLGSTFVIADGSRVDLRNVELDLHARTASGDASVTLALGAGSCWVGTGARACATTGHVRLKARYEAAGEAWRTTIRPEDQATEIEIGGGELALGADSVLGLEAVRGALSSLECVGEPDSKPTCTFTGTVTATLAAGSLLFDDNLVRFDSLELKEGQFTRAAGGLAIALSGLRAKNASLCDNCDAPGNGMKLELSTMEIPKLAAERWDRVEYVNGAIELGAGRLVVTSGTSRVDGRLRQGATIKLSSQARSTVRTGTIAAAGLATFGFEADLEDIAVVADGVVQMSAEALRIKASIVGADFGAALEVPAVVVSGSPLGRVRISNVECRVDRIDIHSKSGRTRVRTHGLAIASPKQEVLEAIHPAIPARHVGDEKPFDNDLGKTLVRIGRPLDLGRLSNFRSMFEASGMDRLQLSIEDSGLRARGDVRGTVRIIANKKHIQTTTCKEKARARLPYPCFYHWKLQTCYKEGWTWVSYPCVKTSHSDEDVFSASLRFGVDVTGNIGSNAPAKLGKLELFGDITRCRIDVHGINDLLEQILGIRKKLCRKLETITTTYKIGERLSLQPNKLLDAIEVRNVNLTSDNEDAILELDLDVSF